MYSTYILVNFKSIISYHLLFQDAKSDAAAMSLTIQDTAPYMLAALSDEDKLDMGFPLDLNLQTCTYNQQYCNMHKLAINKTTNHLFYIDVIVETLKLGTTQI